MELKDTEIVELAKELETNNVGRNQVFSDIDNVIWESRFLGYLDEHISEETRKSVGKRLIVNLVKTRVRDKISLFALMPDVKVSALVSEQEDAVFWAEVIKRVIVDEYWKLNNMAYLLKGHAYQASTKGFSVLQVWPDMGKKKVRIVSRQPAHTYAEGSLTDDGEYDFVIFVWKATGRQILTAYPKASLCDITYGKEPYEMIEYNDKTRRLVFANGRRIPGVGIEHDFGFLPIRIIPNAYIPGRISGLPDITREVIGFQENLNDMLLLSNEERRERLGADLFLKNARYLPKALPGGRGGIIEGRGDVDAKYLSPISNIHETATEAGLHEHLFRVATNWPSQRSGVLPVSVATGKGIIASQSGVFDEAQATKEMLAHDLVKINEYCVAIDRKVFKNRKQKIETSDVFTYIPGTDLPEKFDHAIQWPPWGSDLPTVIVNLLQLYGQGVFDLQSVLETIPGVNAAEVMRRLERDAMKKASLAAQAQTVMGGMMAPGEEMPAEEIERAAYGLEKGAQAGAPSLRGGLPSSPSRGVI